MYMDMNNFLFPAVAIAYRKALTNAENLANLATNASTLIDPKGGLTLDGHMPESLLIVGASARAAASSALRAGFMPAAIDRFGDADLQACCESCRSVDYPRDLPRLARGLPDAAWLYTGALENRPEIVAAIARERTLYGNPGDVLRRVRDPFLVAGELRRAGLPHLPVRQSPPDEQRQAWLRKPYRSCGGSRIRRADQLETDEPGAAEDRSEAYFFQRFVDGVPCSALFIGDARRAVLLGATRQLIGLPWTGAAGFQYCGSIGPLAVDSARRQTLWQIGQCLTERFGLRGLFGVDLVLAGRTVWPIEVNPRYTASVEVVERVSGRHAIALHVAACRGDTWADHAPARNAGIAGKAILYATRTGQIGRAFCELARQWNAGAVWPVLADLPAAGTRLQPGEPIASVLTVAASPEQVERQLRELATQVRSAIDDDSLV
jgi:predicted ATP-grasp superfamily ATP-dependent carboligase